MIIRAFAAASVTATLLATTAHADCQFTGPTAIACDSAPADQATQINETIDFLTIDIAPGASVSDPNENAIDLGGINNTVTNNGTIEAPASNREAIAFSGDNFTVVNGSNGVIKAGDRGIEGDGLGVRIVNSGLIEADDDAIRADGGNVTIVNDKRIESFSDKAVRARGLNTNVTNGASGVIASAGEAVEGRDGFVMDNAGDIISSGDDAVQFGAGTLTNQASGRIIGGDDGVDADSGMIVNFGMIETTGGGDGIDIDEVGEDGNPAPTLIIENYGSIIGEIGINHDPASTAAQDFLNAGLIRGKSGVAIQFASGQMGSRLKLAGNSMLEGDVVFGDANDLLEIDDLTSGQLGSGLFDGMGGDMDVVDFLAYDTGDILDASLLGDVLALRIFASNGDLLSGSFTNFELFRFTDGEFTAADLVPTAPIPLPAAAPLLLAAFGGLVAAGRRRR